MTSPCDNAMKALKYLTFVGIKVAFAALTFQEEKNDDIRVVDGTGTNVSIINSFSADLWAEIGSFLPFPQQELGFLNKTASYAVFKLHPYRIFVAKKFGIHELTNFNNDKDMAWFKNLVHVDDPLKVFLSISFGLFYQRAFPNSIRPLFRYIMRAYLSLPSVAAANISPSNSLLEHVLFSLYEIEDYQVIIEIYKSFPSLISVSICSIDLNKSKKLIEEIFNVPEGKLGESIATFNLLLNNIFEDRTSKLLYSCILANVPLNIYIDRLLNNFENLVQVRLYGCQPKLSGEESRRINETMLVILDNYHAERLGEEILDDEALIKADILYEGYKIMFKIGLNPETEDNIYELEIKNGNFDSQYLKLCAYYALLARRFDLFKQIFNDERLRPVEDISYSIPRYRVFEFVYAVHSYEQLPKESRKIILNSFEFLDDLRYIYDPIKINFDEEGVLAISFKIKAKETFYMLPETFEYVYDTKIESISDYDILSVIMTSNITLNIVSFIEFFESIVNCPFFKEALTLTQSNPLNSTMSIIERFSQSERLNTLAQESGIKFYFDYKTMSDLFRQNILDAKFVVFRGEHFEFLPLLTTRLQIQNFEEFMEKSIADIFLIDTLPYLTLDPTHYYYKFRTILHYLLNGPHRERLLELDIPEFRLMLAKEVCENDAMFLIQGLEPENQNI